MAQQTPARKSAPSKKAPAAKKTGSKTEKKNTTAAASAPSNPNDRLRHAPVKNAAQVFTNPFKMASTKEEAEALAERLIKTGAVPQPHSCSAVIVNAQFDEEKKCVTSATVRHYDAVKMQWSEPIKLKEEELVNYHG